MKYNVIEIPVKEILLDNEFNCRGYFTLESVESLAKSIKEIGLQFPLLVQPYRKKYRLLAGHRRFKAIEVFLKWTTAPAIVREDLTEHQARLLNLTENLQRRDLNILQEANALAGLYPEGVACEGGVSLNTVAKEINKPSRWVHIRARLLKMPMEIHKYAAAGWLSAVNLEALWGLPEKGRITAARRIVKAKKEKGKTAHGTGGIKRSFVSRKSKRQICEMIAYLYNNNIEGLYTRLLAWTAGYLSDEEMNEDIKDFIAEHKLKPRPLDKHLVPRISKSKRKKKRGRPAKKTTKGTAKKPAKSKSHAKRTTRKPAKRK